MTFLSSIFLWALPVVGVPVVLHWFKRKPPRHLQFSYIPWIREAHRRLMPRRQLNNLLLLIVRVMLLLFIILFFARPVFQPQGVFNSSTENSDIVFLIDESASMGHFSAMEKLSAVVRKLPQGVRVGAVAYTDRVERLFNPTLDRQGLLSWISQTSVKPRPTHIKPALEAVRSMLAVQPSRRQKIVIFSDLAQHGWNDLLSKDHAPLDLGANISIYLWEVKSSNVNAGVASASLDLNQEGLLQGAWVFNNLSGTVSRTWQLVMNGHISARGEVGRGVDINHETPLRAQLPRGGTFWAEVRTSQDDIPFDDVFYLAGRIPEAFNLLMVDGQMGTAPIDSETYFLRLALESLKDARLNSVQIIRPDMLNEAILQRAHVVVLANTGLLNEKQALIKEWVEKGGGLFLSAGANWPKTESPLGLFHVSAESVSAQSVDVESLSFELFSHQKNPVFEWDQIRVDRHVVIQPLGDTSVLIRLKNGHPLLVEKKMGLGRVMLWSTSLNRAWTNIPGKPVFAPLMRDQLFYLADPSRSETSLVFDVDSPIRLRLASQVRVHSIEGPEGIRLAPKVNLSGFLELSGAPKPGHYHVRTNTPAKDFYFAVNVKNQDSEGDMTPLSTLQVRQVFSDSPIEWISAGEKSDQRLLASLEGKELTTLFFILAVIMFILETLLCLRKQR